MKNMLQGLLLKGDTSDRREREEPGESRRNIDRETQIGKRRSGNAGSGNPEEKESALRGGPERATYAPQPRYRRD